jgi:hypothetical protein
MSKEQIENEVQSRYNGYKELVDHIVRLNHLGHKNGTPIFPRNGFLLGIVRHNGFLPNEGIDADLACFEDDIQTMLESNWEEYEIDKHYFGGGEEWDADFNNLRHPITNRKYLYFLVRFKHTSSGWISPDVDCFYRYKPGYYYYPWWSIKGLNSENEFLLNTQSYDGGGVKILLGDKEIPLKHLYENKDYLGKVGYLYKENDLHSFVKHRFYDKQLYIPNGSKNMLISDYGKNVLEVMIDKKGHKVILN